MISAFSFLNPLQNPCQFSSRDLTKALFSAYLLPGGPGGLALLSGLFILWRQSVCVFLGLYHTIFIIIALLCNLKEEVYYLHLSSSFSKLLWQFEVFSGSLQNSVGFVFVFVFNFCEKFHRNFHRNCLEPMDCLGYYGHCKVIFVIEHTGFRNYLEVVCEV